MQLGYFCNTKGQRGFISTLAFFASHEGPLPEWRSMLANKQEISPDWRAVAPVVPRQ